MLRSILLALSFFLSLILFLLRFLSLYPPLLIILPLFSSVLFSFSPLPRSLVPRHIDEECQDNMHSDHGYNGGVEVAVVAGVAQRCFKQICLCCKVQSNGKSYHQDSKKQKSLQYRYQRSIIPSAVHHRPWFKAERRAVVALHLVVHRRDTNGV